MSVEEQTGGDTLSKEIGSELKGYKKWLKANRWRIFGWLALSSAATVFYVSNVFAVNNLLKDNQIYRKEIEALRNSNDLLNSRAAALQSAERIMTIAETKLGMVKADRAPEIIK